jgi:hypothetical protein
VAGGKLATAELLVAQVTCAGGKARFVPSLYTAVTTYCCREPAATVTSGGPMDSDAKRGAGAIGGMQTEPLQPTRAATADIAHSQR